MDKYYKVVRFVEDGRYMSAMRDELPSDFVLTYKLGELTKKTVQSVGIFTFNFLHDARAFALDYYWSHILVGTGKKCRKQAQFYCTRVSSLRLFYQRYLAGRSMNKYYFADYLEDSFPGTVLLDSFIPERIVTKTTKY